MFIKYLYGSLWWPNLDYRSVMVHQVFVEIPLGNNSRVLGQISPDWTGLSSVNINLLEDLELGSVLVGDQISDLVSKTRFLTSELIAGKS